jgi:hypothetical protein
MNFFASASDEHHSESHGAVSLIHPDSHHGNVIVVPDAELLFGGDFHRSGQDLVLTGHDGRHYVIPSYFASEHPPTLAAPNGAHLSADMVELLAGSVAPHEYAQAQTQSAAAADSIGKVQKVGGNVTVLRNGVSVALNVGDVVYKSDVVVTGADAKVGITFPDGTALELLANTRMALNEYTYDARSNSNGALFTLVEGTFGFVAGKVAHTGDMKIGTPVATMGIRGTTGVIQSIGNGTYSFSVYDDPGTTRSGSWDMLFQNADGTTTVIATVSQTGYVTFITPQGIGLPPLVTTMPLSASQQAADQLILQDLFDTYSQGGPHSIGIPGSPENPLQQLPPNFTPEIGGPGTQYTFNFQLPGLPTLPDLAQPVLLPEQKTFSDTFIWPVGNGTWPTGSQWLSGSAPNGANDKVIIESGIVTYNLNLTIYSLTIDAPAELDIIGGALAVTNGLIVDGKLLVDGDPPLFASYGTATIDAGGQIIAGALSVVQFSPDFSQPVTALVTVNNFGTLTAQDGGDMEFIDATVTNGAGAQVDSTGTGSIVDFTDTNFSNSGAVTATDSGGVFFVNAGVVNNAGGSIMAQLKGAITFATSSSVGNPLGIAASLINFGQIAAQTGGQILIEVPVGNEAGAGIGATGKGSSVTFNGSAIGNLGTVGAADGGTVKFVNESIANETGGEIMAGADGLVGISQGGITNFAGAAVVADQGDIDFENTFLLNSAGGQVTADDHGRIKFENGGSVTNLGTIEATTHGSVTFDGVNGVVNEGGGEIEAKDHGVVRFKNVSVTNYDQSTGQPMGASGGLIAADGSGSVVELTSATIIGGTLQTRNEGRFETVSGDSTFLNVTLNGAVIQLDFQTSLALSGGSSGIAAEIDKTVVFEGPGVVTMAYQSYEIVAGQNGGELINDATIIGLGQIGIGNGALTFVNQGLLTAELVGPGHGDEFIIDTGAGDDGAATLFNSGTLEASAHATLLIEDSTVDNARGLIVADAHGIVSIQGATVGNAGSVILAEHDGFVQIESSTVDNTFGLIAAFGRGAVVDLVNSTFIGGFFATGDFSSAKDGLIEITGGANTVLFDGSGEPVTVDAFVKVDPGATLALKGMIDNEGTIDVDGAAGADLQIDGTVVLVGGGVVTLEDSGDKITGLELDEEKSAKLENYSTIDGAGSIGAGDGTLKLVNEAAGHIIADGGEDTTLTIDTGANRIINDGVMKAVDFSVLDIESKLDNYGRVLATYGGEVAIQADVVNEAGGKIIARDGGLVELDDSKVTNEGGGEDAGRGLILAKGEGAAVSMVGDTVNNDGVIAARNGGTVDIDDSIVHNDGLIAARGKGSTVTVAGDTVDNDGHMVASKGGTLGIYDATIHNAGGEIVATGWGSLVVLAGSDVIGGDVFIEHHGVLDIACGSTLDDVDVTLGANAEIDIQDGAILTLDDDTTIFGGTLTIENGGKLVIESGKGATLDGVTVENFGKILVDEPGSIVPLVLTDDTTVTGGKLAIGSDGLVHIEGTGATFDGVAVHMDEGGGIEVGRHGEGESASGTILTLEDGTSVTGGKISVGASATLDIESAAGATFDNLKVTNDNLFELGAVAGALLVIEDTVTFDGTGTVKLENQDDQIVSAGDSPATLDNFTTIKGEGTIGDGVLGLVNEASSVIEANASHALVLDVGGTLENSGTLEATHGATLDIKSDVDNGATGQMSASGNGSILELEAVTVTGGTITIGAADALEIENGATHLNGVDVENHGNLLIDSGSIVAWLELDTGSTIHGGTVTIGRSGELDIDGATLGGVTINDSGILNIEGPLTLDGNLTVNVLGGQFIDTGVVSVADGANVTLSGAHFGTIDIGANATLALSKASVAEIDFTGTDGTLRIDSISDIPVTIVDFAKGDVIDLEGLTFSKTETAIWDSATDALTISNGTLTERLHLSGTYSQNEFALTQDGTGTDVMIVDPVLTGATSQTAYEYGAQLKLGVSDGTAGTVTITGLPTDLTLVNGGTYTSDGTWSGTKTQFNALSFTAGDEGTFHLVITEASSGQHPVTTTDTYTLTITDAPLTTGTVSVTGSVEGVTPASLTATFTDANTHATASDFSGTIDWGDGNSTSFTSAAVSGGGGAFTVSGVHNYAEDGHYTVSVAINDDGGSSAAETGSATVADAPLTAGTLTVKGGVEGVTPASLSATFSDTNLGATASDFSGTINWGDGATTAFTSADITANGGGSFTVNGTHQYAEEGSYAPTVTINDAGGSSAHDSGSASVADAPLTPGAVTVSGGVEGVTPASLSATFTDGDTGATTSDFSGTINWGDGTTTVFTSADVTANGAGAFTVNGTHQYAEEGSYAPTVTINDDGGSKATDTGSATVADAPLTASGVPTLNAAVGTSTGAIEVASFTDANPNTSLSDFKATIDWGDGTTSTGTITENNGVFSVDGSHTYGHYGHYSAGVSISDTGGQTAGATFDVSAKGATSITSATTLGVVTEDDSYLGNLIGNGGFETYNYNRQTNTYTFPDWTFGGNFYYPPAAASPPHGGYSDLAVYTYTLGTGTASETFATDIGQTYAVTFYVYKESGDTTSSFSALWNGATEVSLVNTTNFDNYVAYQFDAVATTSTTTLQFDFDTGYAGYWLLDDVSVVPASNPGTETRTGTIAFTATDTADSHTVNVMPDGTGYLGTFTATVAQDTTGGKTGDVTWHYTVSDSALASLAPGQEVTQTYAVTIDSAAGAPVEQDVTIELVGIQAPTSFVFTPYTAGLSQLQLGGSLNSGGGGEIGTFTQSGGPAGDSYTFSIGGSGASFFAPDGLVANQEILYTQGTHTVPGGNPANVYALTVTVTDATTGAPTGALPFDVVVGDANANTINLETGANNLGISATTPTIVYGLNGGDTISGTGMTANVWFVGGAGADTMTGGTGLDRYLYGSAGESKPNGADTITNFHTASATGADHDGHDDVIDLSGLTFAKSVTLGAGTISSGKIGAASIGWVQNGADTDIYVNTSKNAENLNSADMEIVLKGFTASWLSANNFSYSGHVVPAGVAGAPINLALTNPGADASVSVTLTDVPAGWALDGGKHNADGSWTVQTSDVSSLTVTTPADFAGAMVLNVTETWTNTDGTVGTAFVADNVEAYAPGSPIFALAGDDNLTGAGGSDTFVFAQPIGNDTIYNFNAASDKIDLAGFAGVNSFGDLHIADDMSGDAVIALGNGETITLHGVDASALSANFAFNATPVTENTGAMTLSDGAVLPLSGTVDNTGTIAIASVVSQTELQLMGNGMTLEGGGHVALSGEAVIAGTTPSTVFDNIDNTVSGAGQIGTGDGNLTLVNEVHGTIVANASGADLTIDTGHAVTNQGVLEATNGGTLHVEDAVTGTGSAVIADGTIAFDGPSTANVTFDNSGGHGELELGKAASFTGAIAGFTGTDTAHSDVVDLGGIDFNSAQFAETYHAATGVLSVTDGTNSANVTFDNFQGALDFASDGHGGTAITDAPAEAAANALSTASAQGTLSFADNDAATDLSTSVTPDGQNYVGNLTTGTVTESNGTASVDYGFSLGSDQIHVGVGQTVTQSYQVSLVDGADHAANATQTASVSIGGAGNDNFVFGPGVGADTVLNFNTQQDTVELDHFGDVQTVQELQSLITSNTHGDAVMDLSHSDSVTLAGVTPAQLQQAIQAGHVLFH